MANKKDFIASGPTKPDIQKSKFDLSYTNNFTASFGKIYPLGSWLLPAGSSFRCDCTYGFDLQPLVFPVQTNMRFHVKFYKSPLRILWKNWRNLVSRGGKGYELPYINRDFNFYETGSLSDYMGVPSFQTSYRTSLYKSTFSRPYLIGLTSSTLQVGMDVVLSELAVARTIISGRWYLSLCPINGRLLDKISGNPLVLQILSNVVPTFNSNAFIGFFVKRSDSYQLISSLALTSANTSVASISGGYYNVSVNVSSLPLDSFSLIDNLYLGVWANSSSHLFNPSSDNSVVDVPEMTIKSSNGEPSSIDAHTLQIYHNVLSSPQFVFFDYELEHVGSNATHFQSVDGAKPKLPLLAFRWRMYEFIYNYFIRNERVTPFMLPDGNGVMSQVFNQYLTNDGDGADSTTPVDFKYAPYEYDLFTTCVKQPTFGDAPLVGVSFNYNMSGDSPTGEFLLLREGETAPETYQVSLDDQGRLTGITSYSVDASHPNVHNLQEIINFGVSINDLRNVSAYQRFLERMVKAGTKYENIMYEFFGTNPPIGEEFPSYLGGYTQMIRTDKVLNQTASDSAKLGEYGGNAYLRSKDDMRPIRAFCQEDCYIMAVGWFSVTPTYSQKLDKDFVFTNYLDFVNPAFASISPQPVYDYQIAPLEINPNDEEALTHVFGYNRPFAEAVSRQDECHGLFRSDMQGFIMQRIFGGVPQLNERFLYMRPEDLTQIFAVTDTTDKIFGQIHFKVNSTLPLPHMAIPKIL